VVKKKVGTRAGYRKDGKRTKPGAICSAQPNYLGSSGGNNGEKKKKRPKGGQTRAVQIPSMGSRRHDNLKRRNVRRKKDGNQDRKKKGGGDKKTVTKQVQALNRNLTESSDFLPKGRRTKERGR